LHVVPVSALFWFTPTVWADCIPLWFYEPTDL